MIHPFDPRLLPTDEVFTHIDDDGTVRHFAIGVLTRMLLQISAPTLWVAIEQEHVDFILANRGVEQEKLDRMTPEYRDKPIIGAVWYDGSVLIIDGHHRYIKRHQAGFTEIEAIPLPPEIWEDYLLDMDTSIEEAKRLIYG